MFDFHLNKDRYFAMQKWVTTHHVMPFISEIRTLDKPLKVLEIGCAEAGVLASFIEAGHYGTGIELSESRAEKARNYLSEAIKDKRASIVTKNIYDVHPDKDSTMKFDVVILKDVIEHIPNQNKFIGELAKFLNPQGVVFFAYPPWWMPFGGHQQLCKSKILSKLPWFHLLPMGAYKGVLRLFGESDATIEGLEEIKETGINIEEIQRLIRSNDFQIVKETIWFTNPIYSQKFGFKPIKQVLNIPYLRNIISTCHYVAFSLKN